MNTFQGKIAAAIHDHRSRILTPRIYWDGRYCSSSLSPPVSHFPALWVRCATLHQFLAVFLKEARGNSMKSHFLPTTGSARSLSGGLCQPSLLLSQQISGLRIWFSTQKILGKGTSQCGSMDGRGKARRRCDSLFRRESFFKEQEGRKGSERKW